MGSKISKIGVIFLRKRSRFFRALFALLVLDSSMIFKVQRRSFFRLVSERDSIVIIVHDSSALR